jgi:hypothetical protein
MNTTSANGRTSLWFKLIYRELYTLSQENRIRDFKVVNYLSYQYGTDRTWIFHTWMVLSFWVLSSSILTKKGIRWMTFISTNRKNSWNQKPLMLLVSLMRTVPLVQLNDSCASYPLFSLRLPISNSAHSHHCSGFIRVKLSILIVQGAFDWKALLVWVLPRWE